MQSNARLKIEPTRFRGPRFEKMQALSRDMTQEAVAGLLWMHLDVPEDASRGEVESYAHEIVRRVRAHASEAAIAEHLGSLQSNRFCQIPNIPAIRALASRTVAIVRRAGGV